MKIPQQPEETGSDQQGSEKEVAGLLSGPDGRPLDEVGPPAGL